MKLESFIAKRYLVSKHKVNFITIISVISVIGITLGVAALIVVLSVFNGFGSLVTSFLVTLDPHIKIEAANEGAYEEWEKVEKFLSSDKRVRTYSPFVSGKVVALNKNNIQVVNLKGISEISGTEIYELKKNIRYGEYSLNDDINSLPEIIIGIHLADKLQVLTGDTLTIVSPHGIERAVTQFSLPRSESFIISGIFISNNNEYDEGYLFSALSAGQRIFGLKDNFQGYEARLDKMENAFRLKDNFETQLKSENFSVNTWYDFHRDLYTVMQIERWAAYIILSLIIAVATFNILGSLSMSVIEKKRDIGILRSMGATEKSILKIFMYEGLLIGLIGTAAGTLIGYFVCFLQLQYKIYPLDPTQYKIDALPLELRITDFFFVAGMSLLLSFIASLIPSRKAVKIDPVEAIKWE